jgi:amidophosphoribosyltransferase
MSQYFIAESKPREECGVFAVYGNEDAARVTFFGLFALQHRERRAHVEIRL